MGPRAPFLRKMKVFKMNKRLQAREWKRTEKTRCYTRVFEFVLFVHVDERHNIETRMAVKRVETEIPKLDPYVIGSSFLRAPTTGGTQFIIPSDGAVVDFIMQFAITGKYPDGIDPVEPVPILDTISDQHKIGRFTFNYEVNEYQERQSPGLSFPWQGRVWDTNHEMTQVWHWNQPSYMKTWLGNTKALKALSIKIRQIEELQAWKALRLLSKA